MFHSLVKVYERFIDILEKIETWISCLLLGILIFVALMEVVSRYLFSRPFPWALESCTLLFTYTVFIGIPPMYKGKRLVIIEYVFKRLPIRIQKMILFFWEILFGFFFVYLAIASYQFLSMQMRYRSPGLNIPFGYFTLPLLVCSVSMLLFNVYFIGGQLKGYIGNKEGSVSS
jgi:TRAP-type C4-dicarboxylate transport system permease small subunit